MTHIYLKRSNAQRGAERLTAKTGEPHTVNAAGPNGFVVVKVPPARKPAPAAKAPKGRATPQRAAVAEAAERGILPTPPDFTAATHKPYRAKLAALIELANAGDAKGLAAVQINPTSSSPKAMLRYRDLAVIAIKARRA